MFRLCCILYFVILFVRFAVLHFVNELLIAFNANSACLELFQMSTIIVL